MARLGKVDLGTKDQHFFLLLDVGLKGLGEFRGFPGYSSVRCHHPLHSLPRNHCYLHLTILRSPTLRGKRGASKGGSGWENPEERKGLGSLIVGLGVQERATWVQTLL